LLFVLSTKSKKKKYLSDLCAFGVKSKLIGDGRRGLNHQTPELGKQHASEHQPTTHKFARRNDFIQYQPAARFESRKDQMTKKEMKLTAAKLQATIFCRGLCRSSRVDVVYQS
jgi:hypothetical protein